MQGSVNKVAGYNPSHHILRKPAAYTAFGLSFSIQQSKPERANADGYEHDRKHAQTCVIYSSLCAQKLKFHLNSGCP